MAFLVIFAIAVAAGIAYLIVDVQIHKKSLKTSQVEDEATHFVEAVEAKVEAEVVEVKKKVAKKAKATTEEIKAEVAAKVAEVEAKVKKASKKVTKNK